MFKVIFEVWRREHAQAGVQKISEGFYQDAVLYMKRLREELQSSQLEPLRRQILSDQLAQSEFMLNEIQRIRVEKIAEAAVAGGGLPKENLMKEDARLYDSIRESLERHLHANQQPPEQPKAEKKVLLRFLQEVPEFVGVDLNSYGPFRPEDVSAIPLENAVQLIKKNYAMEIEESP